MSDTEESVSTDSWPINEDWLIEMLKKHHSTTDNIKIVNFAAKQGCQQGVSNLSDILMVSAVYEIVGSNCENQNLEFIIKLLPHDPFSRYFVTEAQFDFREINFYTKILPDLVEFQDKHIKSGCEKLCVSVPKCFYTHYSPGKLPINSDCEADPPESILVLEDMRAKDYKSVAFTSGLSLEQAEEAIKSISAIHALSLSLKFKEKVNLNERYSFLFQTTKATESYHNLVEQGIPQLAGFLESTGDHSRELEILEQLRPKTKEIIQNLLNPVEPMGLICHTDFWSNNLLFKTSIDPEKNDNCCVLDWQMISLSRPTNDVALLLTSSLNSNTRRMHQSKLLDTYYNLLKVNCTKFDVDIEVDLQYSRNKMECDFRKSQLLAFLLCIGSVDIALGNNQTEQRLLDVLHDFYADKIFDEYLTID